MTPEEILDTAIDYINDHGWCQGTIQKTTGEVCIQGAVMMVDPVAQKLDVPNPRVMFALCVAIADAAGGRSCNTPWFWNDNVCRDADEAIHMLKKAKDWL